MAGGKTNAQRLQEQAEKQIKKAKEKARAKAEFVQKTKQDIPIFPYGYHDKATNPNGRVAPSWVKKPSDFINDWLNSMPTVEELKNLYGQLDQYMSSMSPHMLSSSRERVVHAELTFEGTAVTPVCFDGMRHLYHIIRIRGDQGRFLDFLRQNATGYILAFRLADSLELLSTAFFCYFCDHVNFVKDLTGIFKFKRTQYRARYQYPWKVKFGRDTMNHGIHLLSLVYEEYGRDADADADGDEQAAAHEQQYAAVDDDDEPDAAVDDDGADDVTTYRNSCRDPDTVLACHFFFFAFGECPRSDLFKDKMFETITSEDQENCEPVGLVFDGLARNWNYACKTALLLRLMINTMKIAPALKVARPDIYLELKKELKSYSKLAQERCQDIVGHVDNIQDEFRLIKEKVHKIVEQKVVGCYIYKNLAYDRIVNDCLSLIMYSELVLGAMLRDEGYKKPLYLDEFVVKESSSKAIDAEAVFIAQFNSFAVEHPQGGKRQSAILLGFLDAAVLFLKLWCYTTLVDPALDLEDVKKWSELYKVYKQSMPEVKAGNRVMGEWTTDNDRKNKAIKDVSKQINLKAALKALVNFIRENCLQDGSDIDEEDGSDIDEEDGL